MNAFPPLPPLDAKQVKTLVRMIRVLRYDHPNFGADELAREFEEQQRWLAQDGRPSPFLAWLDGSRWRAGFDRALEWASRVDERRVRERAARKRYKDVLLDRQPASAAQLRYVKRLAKRNGEESGATPTSLSKLGASRLIQRYLDHLPPTP